MGVRAQRESIKAQHAEHKQRMTALTLYMHNEHELPIDVARGLSIEAHNYLIGTHSAFAVMPNDYVAETGVQQRHDLLLSVIDRMASDGSGAFKLAQYVKADQLPEVLLMRVKPMPWVAEYLKPEKDRWRGVGPWSTSQS